MSDTKDRQLAEDNRYPNVVRFVRETPWAILEPKLHEIDEMLRMHLSGHEFTREEIEARIGSGPARKDSQRAGEIAILPIYGVITPRADLMTDISGGTSIDRLRNSLHAAVADDSVKAIVLDVDSPGGSVGMLGEMAQEIRDARRVKPVVAVANTMAASAGYYLASQASEMVVTPSGWVGAIGTIVTHTDISGAEDKVGAKTTVIASSKYKGELSPFKPLSEEARAHLQETVDKFGAMFEQDVARGRGVPVAKVREDFGQGRMLLARDALKAGMVDRVDTLENVVAELTRNSQPVGLNNARSEADEAMQFSSYAVTNLSQPSATGSASSTSVQFQPRPFSDEAESARVAVEALVVRTRSLAEYRDRGSLTASKRERLAACTEALRASLGHLDEVLAATAPVDHQAALLVEKAKLERLRYEGALR